MKKALAIILVLAMLLGLSSTAMAATVTMEDLVGVWNMDIESLTNVMSQTMTDPAEVEAMKPFFAMMTATMEFTADGKAIFCMSLLGQEERQENAFTLENGVIYMDGVPSECSLDGDVLTIKENELVMTFTRAAAAETKTSEADQMAALLALLASQQDASGSEPAAEPTAEPVSGGKLEAKQQNTHFIESYSNYLYSYTKVENVGNREIKLNDCVLEAYDAAGEVIASKDYGDANAAYLKPGEYTYLAVYTDVKEGTPAKCNLNFTEKTDKNYTNIRFPVTTALQLGVEEGWRTRNFMYATVTNNTDEAVYDMEVVLALLDAAGNILYVEDKSLYDCSIVPGDSLIIRLEIPSDFMEYFTNNNVVPTAVDAIAFVEVDQDN